MNARRRERPGSSPSVCLRIPKTFLLIQNNGHVQAIEYSSGKF